jgi:hypothetical protein
MSQRGHLRTSDADREEIAERLRDAATEGRIAPEELDERLGTALSARTYAELNSVVADLPGPKPVRRRGSLGRMAGADITVVHVALAIAAVLAFALAIAALAIAGAIWVLWVAFGSLVCGHKHRMLGVGRHGHGHRRARLHRQSAEWQPRQAGGDVRRTYWA